MIELMYLMIGLLGGIVVAWYIHPHKRVYKDVIKTYEQLVENHRLIVQSLRAKLRWAQENPELNLGDISKMPYDQLVSEFVRQIGPSLPKWARPFLGGIEAWAKENPEKVQQLVQKFSGKQGEQPIKGTEALVYGRDY